MRNLLFIILLMFISCNENKTIDSEIITIIDEYSHVYKLKSPNVHRDYSAKQSYEIGFFKNELKDTLFFIVKMEAYALPEFSRIGKSPFSRKLDIYEKRLVDYPTYMGSVVYGVDSIPIHVYDVFEKVGKSFYDFNSMQSLTFEDFIISDEQEFSEPNLWLYKIKDRKFIKIAETDTIRTEINRYPPDEMP
jgi:hypothetical protein